MIVIPGAIHFSLQHEELTLSCRADANPEVKQENLNFMNCFWFFLSQNVRFLWGKHDSIFEGQKNKEKLSSDVRLRAVNESLGEESQPAIIVVLHWQRPPNIFIISKVSFYVLLLILYHPTLWLGTVRRVLDQLYTFTGEYSCFVSNEVGNSSCRLEVTERMMTSGLSDEDIIIIIISVIAATFALTILLLIITIYCICSRTKDHSERDGRGMVAFHPLFSMTWKVY